MKQHSEAFLRSLLCAEKTLHHEVVKSSLGITFRPVWKVWFVHFLKAAHDEELVCLCSHFEVVGLGRSFWKSRCHSEGFVHKISRV